MVIIPVEYLVIAGIVLLITLYYLLLKYIISPMKAFFGKRLYEYTRIPSAGQLIKIQKWFYSDEEALSDSKGYDFVYCIYPKKHKKKLKPEPEY